MNLIIINGLPATGKTTIAQQLSEELGLRLIAKDTIKEFLFGLLGVADRERSKKLGAVSNELLYELTELSLKDGKSVLVENAFELEFAKPKLERLITKYRVDVVEVYCSTEASIRRQRFIERNESGMRHAGHADHLNYPTEDDTEPLEKYAPLNVGPNIVVDTSADHPVDIQDLVTRLTALRE